MDEDCDSKFRSLDGSCNNLASPSQGAAGKPMPRLMDNAYSDGKFSVIVVLPCRLLFRNLIAARRKGSFKSSKCSVSEFGFTYIFYLIDLFNLIHPIHLFHLIQVSECSSSSCETEQANA